MTPISVPAAPAWRLRARVPTDLAPGLATDRLSTDRPDRLAECEIVIAEGRIAHLGPPGSAEAGDLPLLDLDHGLALPRLIDGHTHLDKGHILARSPNPDGSFAGALSTVRADREAHWTPEDVRARMDFALRCALHHGTGAIRTHLDSQDGQAAITWPVFAEMREAWRGRIDLQAVALFPLDAVVEDAAAFRGIVETVARYGGVLGGVTFRGGPPDAALDLALDRIVDAAAAHGLDLDFHVDESDSPDARSLERIAEAVLRRRFRGRVVAGHCCSLALASDEDRARVIARVAEAGIAVVSLPMCNLYLQDRQAGRTPRWRGVAPVHELDAAGVPVMVASDNTRDPFYAYGDLDMLEVFREATRILHLDHSDRPWARLLGTTAAAIMGLPERGTIAVGGPADLVLTRARTLGELVSRPQSDRAVVIAGRALDAPLPEYRELDGLFRTASRDGTAVRPSG